MEGGGTADSVAVWKKRPSKEGMEKDKKRRQGLQPVPPCV